MFLSVCSLINLTVSFVHSNTSAPRILASPTFCIQTNMYSPSDFQATFGSYPFLSNTLLALSELICSNPHSASSQRNPLTPTLNSLWKAVSMGRPISCVSICTYGIPLSIILPLPLCAGLPLSFL